MDPVPEQAPQTPKPYREHEDNAFPEGLFFPRSQLNSRGLIRFDPPCVGLMADAISSASLVPTSKPPFKASALKQPLSHNVTTVLVLGDVLARLDYILTTVTTVSCYADSCP